jgi:hypothetical protein
MDSIATPVGPYFEEFLKAVGSSAESAHSVGDLLLDRRGRAGKLPGSTARAEDLIRSPEGARAPTRCHTDDLSPSGGTATTVARQVGGFI